VKLGIKRIGKHLIERSGSQRALELARRNNWSWPLTVGVLKPNPGFLVHLFMQPHFVAPILAIEPALRPRRSRPAWR